MSAAPTSPPTSPHDSLAKEVLSRLLGAFGHVEVQHPVQSQPLYADLWFVPNALDRESHPDLTLLLRMCAQPSMVEVFSAAPGVARLKDVIVKAATRERASRVRDDTLSAVRLWVLCAGSPARGLAALGARRDTELWHAGFWALPVALQTHVVVLRELPRRADTLILRLLGRGRTLRHAIDDLAERNDLLAIQLKSILIRRRVMFKQHTDAQKQDAEFLREIERVADRFMEDLREDAEERGKDLGEDIGRRDTSMRLLRRQLQLRLGAMPSAEQLAALERHISAEPLEDLAEKLLLLERDALLAWLMAEPDRP